MKKYRCFKEVEAFQIGCIRPGPLENTWELVGEPDGSGDGLPLEVVDLSWVERHAPKPFGYFVRYVDGYTSYSPREAFESGYQEIS